MTLEVTSLYAGLLSLLLFFLSIRVIRRRRAAGIPIGDAGDLSLIRRQRAQGNFIEYVPIVLLLMALAEAQGTQVLALHFVGAVLLVGRIAHATALSSIKGNMVFRVGGMALTFTSLITTAILNLGLAAGFVV